MTFCGLIPLVTELERFECESDQEKNGHILNPNCRVSLSVMSNRLKLSKIEGFFSCSNDLSVLSPAPFFSDNEETT